MIYTDNQLGINTFIRVFSEDTDPAELIWHRDISDREILVLGGIGWKIQMDNILPEDLIQNKTYFVPKMIFHRIWKGTGDLKVQITENV
jgi:hypothetical protein